MGESCDVILVVLFACLEPIRSERLGCFPAVLIQVRQYVRDADVFVWRHDEAAAVGGRNLKTGGLDLPDSAKAGVVVWCRAAVVRLGGVIQQSLANLGITVCFGGQF